MKAIFEKRNYIERKVKSREKLNYFRWAKKYKISGKVLDVGCWAGQLSSVLRNCEYYGIDKSKAGIEFARKRFNGRFTIGDIRHLKEYYKKEFFDWIICNEVLEHVSNPLNVIKQTTGLLKVDGKLLLRSPNQPSLHWFIKNLKNPLSWKNYALANPLSVDYKVKGYEHKSLATAYFFKKYLEDLGFKILKYDTWVITFYPNKVFKYHLLILMKILKPIFPHLGPYFEILVEKKI